MAQTAPAKGLSYDAATKTVTFALEAGALGTSGPFNFNGLHFVNLDGTPHSAEVIADTDPMPNMGGDPAIPAAYTKDVTRGRRSRTDLIGTAGGPVMLCAMMVGRAPPARAGGRSHFWGTR
jgi:hypothetical protein